MERIVSIISTCPVLESRSLALALALAPMQMTVPEDKNKYEYIRDLKGMGVFSILIFFNEDGIFPPEIGGKVHQRPLQPPLYKRFWSLQGRVSMELRVRIPGGPRLPWTSILYSPKS